VTRLAWLSTLVLLLVVLAQVVAVPLVMPGAARPDLLLVLAVLAGFTGGSRYGLVMGLAGGLLVDVVTGRLVGLHLLIKGAAGAAGGELARHVYRENAPAALLLAAVATVGQELLHALVLRVFSVVVPLAHVFELLPTIITGNLVAAGVLFVPLYRLTRDLAGEPAGRAAGSWPARGGGRR